MCAVYGNQKRKRSVEPWAGTLHGTVVGTGGDFFFLKEREVMHGTLLLRALEKDHTYLHTLWPAFFFTTKKFDMTTIT